MAKVALVLVLLVSLRNKTIAQAPNTDLARAHRTPTKALPRCDGTHFPMRLPDGSNGGSKSCCQRGKDLFHVGPKDDTLGHRQIGASCSMPDNSTCEGTNCAYGPCGARKVQVQQADPNTSIFIFEPRSNPEICGTQITAGGAPIFSPEVYSDQPRYPGVTARCPFTTCLVGGRPALTLTVTAVTHNATGHVESTPSGISLSGAGMGTKVFPRDPDSPQPRIAVLVAVPKGSHARAVFSGNCKHTGDFGKNARCVVPLIPDPKVTVAYECHAGFACEDN